MTWRRHALHMGRAVAAAALSVWGKCVPLPSGRVRFDVKNVSVPSQRPSLEELPQARRFVALHSEGRDEEIPFSGMELTTVVAEAGRMLSLENGPDFFEMPVSAVSIGDSLAFAGVPGEPFTEIGRGVAREGLTPVVGSDWWGEYFYAKLLSVRKLRNFFALRA